MVIYTIGVLANHYCKNLKGFKVVRDSGRAASRCGGLWGKKKNHLDIYKNLQMKALDSPLPPVPWKSLWHEGALNLSFTRPLRCIKEVYRFCQLAWGGPQSSSQIWPHFSTLYAQLKRSFSSATEFLPQPESWFTKHMPITWNLQMKLAE